MISQRTSRVLVAASVIATLVGLSGCDRVGGGDKKTTQERSFDFSGKKLTIEADTTDVRVVPGPAGRVGIDAELVGKAGDKGNSSISLEGTTLALVIECSGFSVHCEGLHIVKVPEGVAVDVRSSRGAVRVVGITAEVTAQVDDGWLKVEDPSGRLTLKASDAVTVSGARSAEVDATSTDRTVSLTFATAPQAVKATASRASATVQLPAGSDTYRLNLSGNANKGNVTDDPNSKRSITAAAGSVDVRTAS